MFTLVLAMILSSPIDPPDPPRYDPDLLARTLERRLTYASTINRDRPVQVAHCRRAPKGCRARVEAFAGYLVEAGRETGVSPWLLAAMAIKESGLNPFAEGGAGEIGILQLHPKRRDASRLRFLADPKYRERCRKIVGACQREVVDLAARILRSAIVKCGGETHKGLRMYNAGRCDRATRYPRMVEEHLVRLYEIAGEVAP
jgi:hypothetical protein